MTLLHNNDIRKVWYNVLLEYIDKRYKYHKEVCNALIYSFIYATSKLSKLQ